MKSLVTTIEDFGNHFLEESEDLIVLDTKEIAGPASFTILPQREAVGKEQYNQFITETSFKSNKVTVWSYQEKQSQFFQFFSTKRIL